jgi:hypothetical protein
MAETSRFSVELEAISGILGILSRLDESQRRFVLRTVMDRLSIPPGDASIPETDQSEGAPPRRRAAALRGSSPKSFLATKKPASEVERVACLAYFLTHMRNTPRFKTKDIVELNTEAAAPRLAAPRRTVDNAMRRSQFLAPAGSGSKQIATLGEQVAEALPDREAVDSLLKGEKKPKRKKPVRKIRRQSR